MQHKRLTDGNTVVARTDFDNMGADKYKRIKIWFGSMSPVELVGCDLPETRKINPKGTSNV